MPSKPSPACRSCSPPSRSASMRAEAGSLGDGHCSEGRHCEGGGGRRRLARKGRQDWEGSGRANDDSRHQDTSPHSQEDNHADARGTGAEEEGEQEDEEHVGEEETGEQLAAVRRRRQAPRECRLHRREGRLEGVGGEQRGGADDGGRGEPGRAAGRAAAEVAAADAASSSSAAARMPRTVSSLSWQCRRRLSRPSRRSWQSSECRRSRRARSRASAAAPSHPPRASSSPTSSPASPSPVSSAPRRIRPADVDACDCAPLLLCRFCPALALLLSTRGLLLLLLLLLAVAERRRSCRGSAGTAFEGVDLARLACTGGDGRRCCRFRLSGCARSTSPAAAAAASAPLSRRPLPPPPPTSSSSRCGRPPACACARRKRWAASVHCEGRGGGC